MRDQGWSLSRAAREFGLAPRTVVRLARSGVRKGRNGRYVARPRDRLLRVLQVPDERGMREIATRDSGEASKVSAYARALHAALAGNPTALQPFEGLHITLADGTRLPLLTERATVERLGHAGELRFESLYARV